MIKKIEKSILLVSDDDELSRKILDSLQERVGKKIIYARNMKEANVKFENQEFDLLLLGMKTPQIESYGNFFIATQKKTANKKPLPWVIISSGVEPDDVIVSHPHSIRFMKQGWNIDDLCLFMENAVAPSKQGEKSIVDVNFINPFIKAVESVLSSMSQVVMNPGRPDVRKNDAETCTTGDISGIISIGSDTFSGSMALIFEKSLALKVYSNMVGDDKSEIDNDVKDAIMELTNIIFGNAKRDLNVIGHSIKPAIPSIISGPGHEVKHSSDGIILQIPFTSEFGLLKVECLISTHQK